VNVQFAIAHKVTATSLFEEDTPPAPVASICHDKIVLKARVNVAFQ
jgi:hypothetical protein